MSRLPPSLLIAVVIFSTACVGGGTSTGGAGRAVPALITSPNRASVDELQTAIASLLNTDHVMIAQSAFTDTSVLSIEPAMHKDNHGRLLMGRSTEMPESVQLFIKGDTCLLEHAKSGQRRILKVVTCRAE
ncbi:hypothetical protein ACWXWU_17810 [Shewanella sp. A14]